VREFLSCDNFIAVAVRTILSYRIAPILSLSRILTRMGLSTVTSTQHSQCIGITRKLDHAVAASDCGGNLNTLGSAGQINEWNWVKGGVRSQISMRLREFHSAQKIGVARVGAHAVPEHVYS
jgi:hypothetical protein